MNEPVLIGLLGQIENPDATRIILSSSMAEHKKQSISKIEDDHGNASFCYSESGDHCAINSEELANLITDWFQKGLYDQVLFETPLEDIRYYSQKGRIRFESRAVRRDVRVGPDMRLDERHFFETDAAKKMLIAVGIMSENGTLRQAQRAKFYQVRLFIEKIMQVIDKIDSKRLTIIDTACGKSYLSFALNYYLSHVLRVETRFVGLDSNAHLIARCNEIKQDLGYGNMEFVNSRIVDFQFDSEVDLLYSLHGCDLATDDSIAKGIAFNAKAIFVAPCCQQEIKNQWQNIAFKGISKYPLLRERFADVVTDTLRALTLEAAGYSVRILKFVPSDITPKNLLIQGIKGRDRNSDAIAQFKDLTRLFELSPYIEHALPQVFGNLHTKGDSPS